MKSLDHNNLAAIDLVCGMQVDPDAKSQFFTSVRGHSYYFCTDKCRNTFKQNPAKYMDVLNITKNRKNWWGRYLDKIQKATDGKPPKCCQ